MPIYSRLFQCMDIKIMNLQSLIRSELWLAISDTYEAGIITMQ